MNRFFKRLRMISFLGCALVAAFGCQEKPRAESEQQSAQRSPSNTPANAPAVTPEERDEQPPAIMPRGQILYQPVFNWSDGEQTAQGTGFFVKAPNGKLAAVTSAHFIDPEGPALLNATWQTIDGEEIAATLTKSWGPPGKLGGSKIDQRRDYLLFPAEPLFNIPHVLEFDPRPKIPKGELIWFADKGSSKSASDQRVVTGIVASSMPQAIFIQLDEPLELQSQSGSPFISQTTGKVIGILAGALGDGENAELIAAPVTRMAEQLQDDSSFPELRTVIGKATPAADNILPPVKE